MKYTASVVIPAYNEGKNIAQVISRVRKVSKKYETIVVDDGSADRTAEIARKKGARVIRSVKNKGKAAACLKGAAVASSENIVFIDADMQLFPEDIPKFVAALGSSDVAVGFRSWGDLPFQRRIANTVAKKLMNAATGRNFRDVLCGFRGVKKGALEKMRLKKRGYEFETEMLLAAVRNRMRIAEIPVSVSYEQYAGMGTYAGIRILFFILASAIKQRLTLMR